MQEECESSSVQCSCDRAPTLLLRFPLGLFYILYNVYVGLMWEDMEAFQHAYVLLLARILFSIDSI